MKILEKSKSNVEDLLIISQIKLFGDKPAFGALVKKYQSPVRRYIYNLTGGNSSLADDISQEVFIKAFTGLSSFKGTGSFRGWLFSIAYRQFIDTHRSFRYSEDISNVPEAYADAQHKLELLNRTLAPLNDTERNLIILSCIDDYSHSEIAKVTGMPLGTVKTHLAKAKEKLKKHLSDDGKYF